MSKFKSSKIISGNSLIGLLEIFRTRTFCKEPISLGKFSIKLPAQCSCSSFFKFSICLGSFFYLVVDNQCL